MRPGGPTAKFAIDAPRLVEYLAALTTYESSGTPARERRLINGFTVQPDTDARIIRRWRDDTEFVTRKAATRLLRKFGLTLREFVEWSGDINPIIRGRL